MANSFNYAQQWGNQLLDTIIQGTLCSPFIVSNVNWLNAKTFTFPFLSTTGYKNHSRNGGWNRGNAVSTETPYTLYHDRDIEFLVDIADVDETNQVASIQNISQRFLETQANPETDAEFFSKLSEIAIKNNLDMGYAADSWTTESVFPRLKGLLKKANLRTYRQRGSLIMYVNSDVMDLLEMSKDFVRKIELTQIADGGLGIETRVTEIDGVPLMEVTDDERFYTEFNFQPEDGGFALTEDSMRLSAVIACTETVKKVPKINSIYFFAPGQHTEGDGYLYQNRAYSGTFVFPNGKNNEIDSIFVCYEAAAPVMNIKSVAGSAAGKTVVTVTGTSGKAGHTLSYKTGAGLAVPAAGTDLALDETYLEFVSGNSYTATTGHYFVVVELDAEEKVVQGARVKVTSKA